MFATSENQQETNPPHTHTHTPIVRKVLVGAYGLFGANVECPYLVLLTPHGDGPQAVPALVDNALQPKKRVSLRPEDKAAQGFMQQLGKQVSMWGDR